MKGQKETNGKPSKQKETKCLMGNRSTNGKPIHPIWSPFLVGNQVLGPLDDFCFAPNHQKEATEDASHQNSEPLWLEARIKPQNPIGKYAPNQNSESHVGRQKEATES